MKLNVCVMRRHAPNPHSCGNGGGLEIASKLEQTLAERGLSVPVERIACFGLCLKGPNVRLLPQGRFWHEVKPGDAEEIVAALPPCDS